MTLVELTQPQQEVMEEMATANQLVIIEGLGGQTVRLTPANFCTWCGGDGMDPMDTGNACKACHGTGGVAATSPPVVLGADGEEA